MTDQVTKPRLKIVPLGGALGARVVGFNVEELDDELGVELRQAWAEHLVLFFPEAHLTPAQQLRLARVFGPRLAATTETGGDYRGATTLAADGFPEILVLDTAKGLKKASTNVWHTDVTFTETPPIGSLFCMDIPAVNGGDTLWSNQYLAYDGLSEPIRTLIGGLTAVHGLPPITGFAAHPMVKVHPVTNRTALFVNRGWTRMVKELVDPESRHLLEMLFERSERADYQIRWQWTAGDAALWDNRCTMHYAVDDYGSQHRAARRATIYDN